MIDCKRTLELLGVRAAISPGPSARPIVPLSAIPRGLMVLFAIVLLGIFARSITFESARLPPSSPREARASASQTPDFGGSEPGTCATRCAIPCGTVYDRESLRDLARCVARRRGVDEDLVLAVIEYESGFDPFAVSTKGAKGLMQLMPRTAAYLGVTNPFDPLQNVDGGVRYLKELLERYDGKIDPALAAYRGRSPRSVPPQT